MAEPPFHDKVRVRVNGLIFKENQIVLVKIKSPTQAEPFWMPPGGGVELGETMRDALKREVLEETNLTVEVLDLWYITEYINAPWHAVEFYFLCEWKSGDLHLGIDPELKTQYLQDIRKVEVGELIKMNVKPSFLAEQLRVDFPNKRTFPLVIDL